MKIRFPASVVIGSKSKLVVELSATDLGAAAGRRGASVEVLLVAPGFSIAPKARQPVSVKRGVKSKATVSFTLGALDAGAVKRQLRADLLVDRVLTASVTASTTIVG